MRFRGANFEFDAVFYLMSTRHVSGVNSDRRPRTDGDWVVSHGKRFRANIILWGMPKETSTLGVRVKLADLGLTSFVRGNVRWEGDHVRLILTVADSKGVTRELVSQVSSSLRRIGCRCVLDEFKATSCVTEPGQIVCSNRFEPLSIEGSMELDNCESGSINLNNVSERANALAGKRKERRLRVHVATWNCSGLCSDRKQKEVGEMLGKHNIDIVAVQETWEKDESRINVEGYQWFGKPRSNQNSRRGEGGVGFFVRDCLVNEVEFLGGVQYEESVWMKMRGERGRLAVYIGCVYMPTDSTGAAGIDESYSKLKEDVLSFKQKGKVVLLGDFNARVGKSVEVDDVIGMFGEETCNASGNRLVSFLNEVELLACNSRKLVTEPEWTRVRPSLKQKSIIDYIITDEPLMKILGDVQVDSTDIGCSDHYLVWMELGMSGKFNKKRKRVIRRWRLDRFELEDVRLSYQKAPEAEVKGFSECIRKKWSRG